MAEQRSARRSFIGPDDNKNYYINTPTAEDIRGADWQYSKTFTKSLMEGIPTSAEMNDILLRRGIIGPEFEQRAEELTRTLAEKINSLDISIETTDKRDFSLGVAMAREELFRWNQRLNGPMSNTCEQMADDHRLEYLTACMIEDEEGDRVWEDYTAYLKEKNQALPLKSRFEVMLYLQGLDSNFLDQTPEAIAMREVEQELLSQAEEAIKAAQAIAREEENVEKTIEEKSAKKPRKSRKKKSPEKVE
jgi:hypothetical protein